MTGGGLGGGVIFVVAALLWSAVLVPAWLRRREFRAAERNAARLQRTLRVLAETSEVPDEVRIEATAREALAREKLLRTAQKRQQAEREAELAEARAEQIRAEIKAQEMQRKQAATKRAARLRRPIVRRLRAVAALGGLLGLVGVFVGAGLALAGSGAAALVWSALVFVTSLGALVLIAPGRTRARELDVETVAVAPEQAEPLVAEEAETVSVNDASESAAAHAEAQRAAAERMRRARALARAREARPAARENQTDSILLREKRVNSDGGGSGLTGQPAASSADAPAAAAASATAPSTPLPQRVTAPKNAREAGEARRAARLRAAEAERVAGERAARERLSRMGVVGDTSEGMPDLDAVLRRRRNAS